MIEKKENLEKENTTVEKLIFICVVFKHSKISQIISIIRVVVKYSKISQIISIR